MKTPVILYKDYTIFTEQYEDKLFLHCDVYKWNKETKKSVFNNTITILLYKHLILKALNNYLNISNGLDEEGEEDENNNVTSNIEEGEIVEEKDDKST